MQAGHALVESAKNDPYQGEHPSVIICGVKTLHELEKVIDYLDKKNIKSFPFREPDIDNELTAVSTGLIEEDQRSLFKKFQLLKM